MTPPQKVLAATALAAISLLPFTTHSSRAYEVQPPKPSEHLSEGTLRGTVTFEGDVPAEKKIDLSADTVCEEQRPHATTEYFPIDDGKVANVLVYVTSDVLHKTDSFVSFAGPAVLEQTQCRFKPRVLGMQIGQPLEIRNSDATHHNTHPSPKVNGNWNISQPPFSAVSKSFDRPEVFIPVRCNQHPSERAYLSVFNHPFFAVTDKSGSYRIDGLPPGSYKVVARHETLGEKTADVTLKGGASQTVDFGYALADISIAKD